MELFLPLQQYIARELVSQQVALTQEGAFTPSEEDLLLTEPQQVAGTMCRRLVQSSFNLEDLLKLCVERGLGELELTLRTCFLDKMSGQSLPVIDQMVRTTKLVTQFFRHFGHMSFADLMENARQVQARGENAVLMPEPPPPQSDPAPGPSGLQRQAGTSASITSTSTSSVSQKDYVEQVQAYSELANFLKRRLSNPPIHIKAQNVTFSTEVKIQADMMINVLIYAQLSYARLLEKYTEDKMVNKNRKQLKKALSEQLGALYRTHGPHDVDFATCLNLIVDYCGSLVGLSGAAAASEEKKRASEAHLKALEDARLALDGAIAGLYTSHKSVMMDFRNRKFSLAAIKEYLGRAHKGSSGHISS